MCPIPVPGLFSDTKFYRYQFRDFFPVPNFSDTGSDTTWKKENFPVPYLYDTGTHYKSSKFLNFGNKNKFWYQIFPILFPVPIFSDTGSDTTNKKKNSRNRYVTLWQPDPKIGTQIPGSDKNQDNENNQNNHNPRPGIIITITILTQEKKQWK